MRRILPLTLRRNFATRYSPASRGPRNSVRRKDLPSPISSRRTVPSRDTEQKVTSDTENVSATLRATNPAENTLLSPVHIPEDPNAVLRERHPAAKLLANSGLVVKRELELMNVMLGFEQANRYVIMDAHGNHVGYMAEQETGLGRMMARQWFRTHRSFTTHVFDRDENEVLRFNRPFSWINSRIRVYDPLDLADPLYLPSNTYHSTSPTSLVSVAGGSNIKVSPLPISDMRVVGEAQQRWAPLRRKYDMFIFHANPKPELDLGTKHISGGLSKTQQLQLMYQSGGANPTGEYHQFAYVNEPFLSWDFSLRSADDRLIGSVNRDFVGFAREIFTDTGVYALRMDAAALAEEKERQHLLSQTAQGQVAYTDKMTGMTLDQRAVMLATAVSIDFDYFSRHSHAGSGLFPWMWFPGEYAPGGAAGGTTAAGEAGVAEGSTAVGEAGAGAVGRAGSYGSVAEGAAAGAAGAGTVAGYDAMRRGMDGGQTPPSQPEGTSSPSSKDQPGTTEEVWGETPPEHWGPGGGAGPDESSNGNDVDSDDFDWF
ncbi:Scramblase-domain-containing protein [Talaromyces proteolyticus]|uniref:Scramblase-domain-containing protein n=1 Tax=Talaromyces proteolyticus TaxID=1131652 RepID=A0AAD4L1S6_9EURO|nr:Scramblase-domain-containing protein [Talaromyces proteolyticus]KAH8702285.1 Scramblase-domain-containing protein [Talaromyces proteolyticus]